MDWTAVWLTARLATCTTIILFILSVPLAYWLVTTPWRGKAFLEAIVALPLVLPPSVVGFYLLIVTGPHSPVGAWYQALTGKLLPFSFEGILLASLLFNLPFAVRPLMAGFAAVDRRLVHISWTLGRSRLKTFVTVTLPLAIGGIISSIVLTFAHTLGEFGVVLMVGGNIPGVTRTLSIAIYDNVQALDYSSANQSALLLVIVAFSILLGTSIFGRRRWPL